MSPPSAGAALDVQRPLSAQAAASPGEAGPAPAADRSEQPPAPEPLSFTSVDLVVALSAAVLLLALFVALRVASNPQPTGRRAASESALRRLTTR